MEDNCAITKTESVNNDIIVDLRLCAQEGVIGVASFITTDEQFQ